MVSKFEIALKECSETEDWLKFLFNTNAIDEATFKKYRISAIALDECLFQVVKH